MLRYCMPIQFLARFKVCNQCEGAEAWPKKLELIFKRSEVYFWLDVENLGKVNVYHEMFIKKEDLRCSRNQDKYFLKNQVVKTALKIWIYRKIETKI